MRWNQASLDSCGVLRFCKFFIFCWVDHITDTCWCNNEGYHKTLFVVRRNGEDVCLMTQILMTWAWLSVVDDDWLEVRVQGTGLVKPNTAVRAQVQLQAPRIWRCQSILRLVENWHYLLAQPCSLSECPPWVHWWHPRHPLCPRQASSASCPSPWTRSRCRCPRSRRWGCGRARSPRSSGGCAPRPRPRPAGWTGCRSPRWPGSWWRCCWSCACGPRHHPARYSSVLVHLIPQLNKIMFAQLVLFLCTLIVKIASAHKPMCHCVFDVYPSNFVCLRMGFHQISELTVISDNVRLFLTFKDGTVVSPDTRSSESNSGPREASYSPGNNIGWFRVSGLKKTHYLLVFTCF